MSRWCLLYQWLDGNSVVVLRVSNFAYKILKKVLALKERRLLLAVSGGRDSMALLHVFHELQLKLKLEIGVVHIHHGAGSGFRDQAYEMVKCESETLGLPFFSNTGEGGREKNRSPGSQSEASLRQFRRHWIEHFKLSGGFELVVFAHHEQDLLETRMIRLVRGTGAQGLRAMSEKRDALFRPFLTISANEIRDYVVKKKIKWMDDPSNLDVRYLRNWMRHVWFPQLLKMRPGGLESLQRSLSLICDELSLGKASSDLLPLDELGIQRGQLFAMTDAEKRRVVARYLQKSGLKNYRLRHVDEIIKRLNTRQKRFAFRLSSHQWRVDENHIYIVR
ncbi:MAG: tRNA lysidine(34) synthetase TilS [Pseudomonadota bacterium]|nr:tRNA lysidine(34) synthetase TilS [Pseudomonadota bacterium]